MVSRFNTTSLVPPGLVVDSVTGRQQQIVHHLGLALGGRPGAGFA